MRGSNLSSLSFALIRSNWIWWKPKPRKWNATVTFCQRSISKPWQLTPCMFPEDSKPRHLARLGHVLVYIFSALNVSSFTSGLTDKKLLTSMANYMWSHAVDNETIIVTIQLVLMEVLTPKINCTTSLRGELWSQKTCRPKTAWWATSLSCWTKTTASSHISLIKHH